MSATELLRKAIGEIKDLRRYRRKVAVIGVAVRLPGGATSSEAYWDVFQRGINGVREIPRDRWDVPAFYSPKRGEPGKMYTRFMGDIEGISLFDAGFFNISPREAEELDPQQRLVLETAYHALEGAGYAGAAGPRDVGVYIGAMSHDYLPRAAAKRDITEHTLIGTAHCMLAGRVAYAFGFEGPALTLDTACSSSLVALHQACLAIKHDDCAMAVVGGVNLILSPDGFIGACQANMVSAEGRCHVFSERSTGYSRAEGCGVVILKDLESALASRDRILAVIEGSSVNQDGASQGITAPNVDAQIRVMRRCLANAGLQPQQVDYLEAHGTGTPLGDPIEVQAIDAVYARGVPRSAPLLVGAAKASIGHAESAAGIAGLVKAILVLQHREAPPILNLEELNPRLQFDRSKIVFPRRAEPLPSDGGVSRAAVSSFGFSGTNAHVILASAPDAPSDDAALAAVIPAVALGAKRPDALRILAGEYAAMIGRGGVDLRRLSYSSQVTRAHYGFRAWLRADDAEKLGADLAALARARDEDLSAVSEREGWGIRFSAYSAAECAAFFDAARRHPWLRERWGRYAALLGDGAWLAAARSLSGANGGGAPRLSALVNLCAHELLITAGVKVSVVHAPGSQALAAGHAAGLLSAEVVVALLREQRAGEDVAQSLAGVAVSAPQALLQIGGAWIARAEAFIERAEDPGAAPAAGPSPPSAVEVHVLDLSAMFARGEEDPICALLGSCYEAGLDVRWRDLYGGSKARPCPLPPYPFQRKAHWKYRTAEAGAAADEGSPLLGRRTLASGDLTVFSDAWSIERYPFLGDHRIGSDAVFPAAGYLEVALRAGLIDAPPGAGVAFEIAIPKMLRLSAGAELAITTTAISGEIKVHARAPGGADDGLATARVRRWEGGSERRMALVSDGARPYPVDDFYRKITSGELAYGESFRTVRELYRERASVLARVGLPDGAGSSRAGGYVLYPPLFDGMLQATGVLLEGAGGGRAYLPVELEGHFTRGVAARELWCRITLLEPAGAGPTDRAVARLEIADGEGEVLGVIERAVFRALAARRGARPSAESAAFEIAWREVPLEITATLRELPAPDQREAVEGCLAAWRGRRHELGMSRLDRRCARAGLAALESLGTRLAPGETYTVRESMARGEVLPIYERLVAKIFDYLVEDGVLAPRGQGRFECVTRALPEESAEAVDAELAPAFELLDRCAAKIGSILRAEIDPLAVLFPGGIAEGSIYEKGQVSRHLNDLVATSVEAAAATLPGDAELAVLEVGAGTGSTTAAILAKLGGRRCTYYYTDVSPIFFELARARFERSESVVFKLLDLEKAPGPQGIPAQRFDVVVAANALHVVGDLARAAEHLNALLKPGGFLVLRELTKPLRWLDFTFGTTRDWWAFSDFRADAISPIVSTAGWRRLLTECGFAEIQSVFHEDAGVPENVIVARRSSGGISATQRRPLRREAPRRTVCLDVSRTSSAVQTALRRAFPGQVRFADHAAGDLERLDEDRWRANLFDHESLAALLKAMQVEAPPRIVVLDVPSGAGAAGDRDERGLATPGGSGVLLALVKACASLGLKLTEITAVTRSVLAGDRRAREIPLAARIYGTMKVLQQEYPRCACAVVGVEDLEAALPQIVREIEVRAREPEVMYEGPRRFTPSLRRAALEPGREKMDLRGCHLVAGGAGGIGRLVVSHLLEGGADRVIVLGRRREADLGDVLDDWRRRWGDRLDYLSCDISDRASLGAALATAKEREAAPLRTVTYSIAGLLDKSMARMSPEEFQAIVRTKCEALLNLHHASLDRGLDNFIVFSSAVTLFGTQGQANHAAANAFLDAFTEHRRARGLPILTVNWGLWSDAGAVKGDAQLQQRMRERGLPPIDSELGAELIEIAFRQRDRRLVLMPIDVATFARGPAGRDLFLSELEKRQAPSASIARSSIADPPPVVAALRSYGAKKRARVLAEIVKEVIRDSLKYDDVSVLGDDANLFQLGVDSLVATDIVSRINARLAVELSATTVFTYPTIAKLVGHVIEENFPNEAAPPGAAPSDQDEPQGPGPEELGALVERLRQKLEI